MCIVTTDILYGDTTPYTRKKILLLLCAAVNGSTGIIVVARARDASKCV